MINIVTLEREYGCRGGAIAQNLAPHLGWNLGEAETWNLLDAETLAIRFEKVINPRGDLYHLIINSSVGYKAVQELIVREVEILKLADSAVSRKTG